MSSVCEVLWGEILEGNGQTGFSALLGRHGFHLEPHVPSRKRFLSGRT